ncbi:hypothetical protein BD289DRAFT_483261 [Coniella lustricola]|uniref:Condensation domain-containing protein n=1 Tax=Coniella lustricola TaxID=2025994 RepID=A0A2T3A617_9PEZI|nr:hypothetical protein BD289DRAFT_483261 [Coniella lustricola]
MASTTARFHPWTSTSSPVSEQHLVTRSLTTPEFMLSTINKYASGHNCPYLGATISVKDTGSVILTAESLQASLWRAWTHVRWLHPTVACQIDEDCKRMSYRVENAAQVNLWAARTAKLLTSHHDGWQELQEKLSRETILPAGEAGDCAFLYAIPRLDQTPDARQPITHFDLLLHVHHGLVDGTGLRSILDAVLVGLTRPEVPTNVVWGDEAVRLSPAALDVAIISDDIIQSLSAMDKEIKMPPLPSPGACTEDLPIGTSIVTQTLRADGLLDKIREAGREHGVKLTGMVQAALVLALVNDDEIEASDDASAHAAPVASNDNTSNGSACTVLSGFDLRTRSLLEPWSQRNRYVGAAVGLEMMPIPAEVLGRATEVADHGTERFWRIAQHIHSAWIAVSQRPNVAAANELRRAATGFIIQGVLASMKAPASKPGLSINYVSDPPGSNQLEGTYSATNDDQQQALTLQLDHYQLVTGESTDKL